MDRELAGVAALLAAVVWTAASCTSATPSGAPPSEIRAPIDYPAGQRIFFQTEELRHVVTLREDGSYLFKSGNDYDGVLATRQGRWGWKKTGTRTAELRLDEDVWSLTFVGYESAFAVNQAAEGMSRVFEFEGG